MTLASPQEATSEEPSRTMELGFEVDDIAAMKAHLSSCGIADYREESMGRGEALELNDNDGHRVLTCAFKGAG
jgi:hypothetical protein